jgi:hypothetical protein
VAVALAAGAALFLPAAGPPAAKPPPGRAPAAAAWPEALRADIPGNLADGPIFTPALFLDAHTAAGTAPSPDARTLRLLIRAGDGTLRELRRLPLDANPEFGTVTAAGDDLVWTESSGRGHPRLWTANLRDRTPARLLTADTGAALFYGSQYDLMVAGGRVYWAAAKGPDTEIRSVALTGGPIRVRAETGTWALSAWPWLVDGADGTGTRTLRNLATGRDTEVRAGGGELTTCGPVWCRVMVLGGGQGSTGQGSGLVRIDLMHPDGSGRRRIAGGAAGAAITDVAELGRFEILSEAGPDAALTGTEGLLVYDHKTGGTVDVSAAVSAAFSRGGVLWWSTGDQDTTIWHTIDLRTV